MQDQGFAYLVRLVHNFCSCPHHAGSFAMGHARQRDYLRDYHGSLLGYPAVCLDPYIPGTLYGMHMFRMLIGNPGRH